MITRVLKGDKKAFQPLVTKYSSLVYSTALRIVGNPATAEDISQEAFWQAFRSLASFRFQSSFSTWLVRIAVNKALDFCRQTESHTTFQEDYGAYGCEDVSDKRGAQNPEESVVKLEEHAELFQKLNKLPPVYRKAIVEHYFNSRSYKEIAMDENVSVKTVESRIYRAKKMLKKMHGGGEINGMPVEMPVPSTSQLGGICEWRGK